MMDRELPVKVWAPVLAALVLVPVILLSSTARAGVILLGTLGLTAYLVIRIVKRVKTDSTLSDKVVTVLYGCGAFLVFIFGSAIGEGTMPVTPEMAAQAQRDAASGSHSQTDIINNVHFTFTWRKGGFGSVMFASFDFTNNNNFAVKDITVTCNHSADSGTRIDSNTRTIYQLIDAHSYKSVNDFDMGFIDNQATQTHCYIANLK
jgi:uncharacterized membrane protein (Fun14 family)